MCGKKKLILLLAALLVAALAGAYATTNGSATRLSPAAVASHGKQAFLQAKCGACHTLADAKAKGKVGPSLDTSRLTLAQMKAIIRKGKRAMPGYTAKLGTVNVDHIAVYVFTARGRYLVTGLSYFRKGSCASCHTLAAARATGKVGPSLDGSQLTVAKLVAVVTKGKGAMPSYAKTFKSAEIQQLAQYITAVRKTAPKPPPPEPEATTGQAVWAKAGCRGCHTLAAAGATGTKGPSLDETKPSVAEIVAIVTNGDLVDAMPGYRASLSAAEIRLVADYVVNVRKP